MTETEVKLLKHILLKTKEKCKNKKYKKEVMEKFNQEKNLWDKKGKLLEVWK